SKTNPYLNRDPRFYATVYYNGCNRYLSESTTKVYTNVGGNCGISNDVTTTRFTRTGYYLRKFNNPAASSTGGTDGCMPVFRLAELYLNFAEAALEAFGPDGKVESTVAGSSSMSAADAVNAVRARVGMPSLPSGLDKNAFRLRYRNERRVELAFEEHRFFDVRRWKILFETDSVVSGMRITGTGAGATYERISFSRKTGDDRYLLFPLPQAEVNKMTQATGIEWQNPGW
ncbi:MAG: RagB/SusD family nutrient uptake outer membrane protein, partial [Bacteroidales bacterium]|nr:RagB/SusD family nutrient uptake outer membrane protein [Bacteroidales bacterium]